MVPTRLVVEALRRSGWQLSRLSPHYMPTEGSGVRRDKSQKHKIRLKKTPTRLWLFMSGKPSLECRLHKCAGSAMIHLRMTKKRRQQRARSSV